METVKVTTAFLAGLIMGVTLGAVATLAVFQYVAYILAQ